MTSSVRFAVFTICFSLLGACVMPSRVDEMAATEDSLSFPASYAANIRTDVTSSNTTRNAAWTPEVTEANFEAALVKSLQSDELYSADGEYLLRADVLNIKEPLAGMDMTVDMVVRYQLTLVSSGREVLTEIVRTTHTATMSDQMVGEARLREAAEQAARANISSLLQKLSM